jgi:hypothetical protein
MRGFLPGVALAMLLQAAPGPLAQAPVDLGRRGPAVGQRVPDFSLTDQGGTTRTLRSILGPNGAMLVFFRSADW